MVKSFALMARKLHLVKRELKEYLQQGYTQETPIRWDKNARLFRCDVHKF